VKVSGRQMLKSVIKLIMVVMMVEVLLVLTVAAFMMVITVVLDLVMEVIGGLWGVYHHIGSTAWMLLHSILFNVWDVYCPTIIPLV
jgi:hypothetical protein